MILRRLDWLFVELGEKNMGDGADHRLRRAFKDVEPVRIGYEFMPRSPEETIPLYLSEEARRRLIANGTYNPDGTVNMETAERAGWTKIWADRQAAAEATARKAAQQTAQTAGFNKP